MDRVLSAKSYMLLQPDGELYIIPAGGGVARRLRYDTRAELLAQLVVEQPLAGVLVKTTRPIRSSSSPTSREQRDSLPVLLEAHLAGPRRERSEFVPCPATRSPTSRAVLDAYSFLRAGGS